MNMLEQSGLPLAFLVKNAGELGFAPPPVRRGLDYRTVVRSLTVMQKDAFVATPDGAVWRLSSDEGRYLNGLDFAPPPLAFLTTGMIAANMSELRALARQRGITIRSVRLIQHHYYTMEGSVPRGTMVAGALPVELEVQIDCDAEQPDRLVLDAVAASPLNGLMQGEHESLFSLTCNGRSLDVNRVSAVAGDKVQDPKPAFQPLECQDTLDEPIIRQLGEKEVTSGPGGPGSALKSEQKRTLHLEGICTLREDGLMAVVHNLYNPQGSSYQLLVEESPRYGGKRRAPDPGAYISAGIGFCFMTQLGRYAEIAKGDLSEYRIVQDTFFTAGGGTGATGRPGAADPVETHVFLDTSGGEDWARELVDMGEQTCFLHAFCRTPLKAKVRTGSIAARALG